MVSIIILSYNTKDLLQRCLTSLFDSLHDLSYEVIVVDNASKDESVSMVRKEFKKVVLLSQDENLGFAKGCNVGATRAKGDQLLFLNSDILLKDSHIKDMVRYLSSNKSVGVVGGKLLNADGTIQRSFNSFYNLSSVALMLAFGDKGELLRNTADTLQYVDWVSGGFLLITKDLFEKIQGFDERFFMYIEDMELCYRVKKLGYTVVFYPKAVAIHEGHGSSNRTFAVVQIYQGLLYFYKKHKSRVAYSIVRCMLRTKAAVLLGIGRITHNGYLTQTYEKALTVSR